MSPLNVNLVDLINELEAELSGSDSLAKITEAQRRANTLNEYGEQLVGHFVASAKEAGASWSAIGDAIGVSKQAAHQRWMTTYFDRYTKRARHIVTLAQERARDRRHGYIGTEHLLLGLLDEPAGLAAMALARLAGSTDAVRAAVDAKLTPGSTVPQAKIAWTRLTKQVLDKAPEQAEQLGHKFVGTEHILLALLAVPEGVAAEILTELNVTPENARATLQDLLTKS